MEDGLEPNRIHPLSLCMWSPWPCRLLQLGSPHYYRGWGRQGYYSVCCLCNHEWIWYYCFLVELQLNNHKTTASFLLPFWCHVSMLARSAFLKFGSKDRRFLSMQIVSQLFLFSHSAFQSWRLKPRGLVDSSQNGCQRCESDKDLIVGIREYYSMHIS